MSGNSFGSFFRVSTFGESHGPALGCIIDGCPPGLELSEADMQKDLVKVRQAYAEVSASSKRMTESLIRSKCFVKKWDPV